MYVLNKHVMIISIAITVVHFWQVAFLVKIKDEIDPPVFRV